MRKIIGRATIPLEELRTIVTEVEGALNNRPLTYVHAEPNEPLPITPADVIGGRMKLHEGGKWTESTDIQTTWKSRCRTIRSWWIRWHREYLREIAATVRTKTARNRGLSVGDVVLLEGRGPRTFWQMCRIEKVYPGRDGVIMACQLRNSSNELLRRSTRHIYPLEDCFK